MQHALAIASKGYLSLNPALLGYIISYVIEDIPVDEIPIDEPVYTSGGGSGLGYGPTISSRNRKITVEFKYKNNTYFDTKYVNSDLNIDIKDMEIVVIDDLPKVVFKNLELKYGKINSLQK